MKSVSFISIIFVFLGITCQKDFEGKIEYTHKIKLIDSSISKKELIDYFGSHTTTYFKNGYYRDVTNAKRNSIQIWRHQDTAIYIYDKIGNDTLEKVKTNTPPPYSVTYKLKENTDTILGYPCHTLIIKDATGSREYFFSKQLSLDPAYYKNYISGYKYEILKKIKAVYLRLILRNKSFEIDIKATKIKQYPLADSLFKIPKDKVLKPMKY